MSAVTSFSIEGMIRGYHVYQHIWTSQTDEVLPCKRESNNAHDCFAVSVNKEDDVVGHIPRKISSICYMFLGRPRSSITCKVTGSRRYYSDLPQGGLEIPCIIEFRGETSAILKVEKFIKRHPPENWSKSENPAAAMDSSDVVEPPQRKRAPSIDIIMPDSQKQKLDDDVTEPTLPLENRIWVKIEKMVLLMSHRYEIDCGKRLHDYHINFAQKIMKSQWLTMYLTAKFSTSSWQ